MILDYFESFSSAPTSGYATFGSNGGAPSDTYNADYQAVDLYNSSFQTCWALTSLQTSGPDDTSGGIVISHLVFEVDLELVSDPSGRKHLGAWLAQDGQLVNGYRLDHIDNMWDISRWSQTNFVSGSGTSIKIATNNNPTFNVGQRHILRVEHYGDRISLYVDNVLTVIAFDGNYKNLRPCIFLYGCTVRVHSVKYQLDEVAIPLCELPIKLLWANIETREQAWPGENNIKETTAHSPEKICPITSASALNAPPARKDFGFIEGVVTRKSVPAAGKHVICLDEKFNLIAETTSAENGYYRFDSLLINGLYAIHAYDNDIYQYAPVGADRRTPEAYP